MENWQEIKQRIYDNNGLCDIYINDVTLEDWRKWIDFVNENYKVQSSYHDYTTEIQTIYDRIDFLMVKNYFSEEANVSLISSVFIDDIEINCFYLEKAIIDNSCRTKVISTFELHKKIVEYLINISKVLGKKVTVNEEEENAPECILVEVDGDNVKYCF